MAIKTITLYDIIFNVNDIYIDVYGFDFKIKEIKNTCDSLIIEVLRTNTSYSFLIKEIAESIKRGDLKLKIRQGYCEIKTECSHQWTELTLFTSSIIYCPNCNKEKNKT